MKKIVDKFHKGTHAFLQIWLLEFRAIFDDKGVMILIFGAGIIYPLLYSSAYSTEVAKDVPVAVVDNDNSSYSRQLLRMIDATEQVAVAQKASTLEEAKLLFYKNEVNGVLLIDEGFGRKILRSERASISVFADAAYFVLYKQVFAGSKIAALTYGAGIEISRLQAKGSMVEQSLKERSPIGYKGVALYNPNSGYGTYAMPAVLLIILQQTLLLGIGMIGGSQHEFETNGHLMQTSLKNGGATALVLGRAMAYFTLYIVMFVFVMILVFRWFNLPHKADLVELFVYTTPFLWASIFLGLSLANFFKHRETSILVLLFTSVPFIFLSGLSWPVEAMPKFWQFFSHAIPSSAGVRGLLKLNSIGTSFFRILPHWWELWLLVVVYFLSAIGLTKWRAIRWRNKLA